MDYLRVSTEEQAKGFGIAYSGKKTARYIERKGWEHVGTYVDDGLSGSLEAHERDDLDRLMHDSRKSPRPFDMVVVNEGRVIGRTGRAFWRWVWELEDLGVYVAVVKKDYDNSTPAGRSQMRKDADYAEEERELIRERTQGGIQEAAEDGMYPGGQVPFGWTVKDGRYAVNKKQAATLRRAYELYMAKRSWQAVALTLNSEGKLTARGQRWTRKNLRRVMTGEAAMNNRIIWRGKNAARRADGTLIYGEQVIIDLPKIFKKKETKALRAALEAQPRQAPARGRVYIVSGLLTSPCGSVYRGHNHRAGVYDYQCKGRTEAYAGAGGTCNCPALNADSVEESIWADVVALLGDAERMKAMAKEWIGEIASEHVDHVSRLAQLDQQIAEQSQVIDVTMPVAARQAAKRGLVGAEAEAAVETAIRPLAQDLANLEKMRSEVTAWQREAEEVTRRARDFERLAGIVRDNLTADLTPELKAELLYLLDCQVEVVQCAPKRLGVACALREWFASRKRSVPTLTDEGWERIKHLMGGSRSKMDRRLVVEALLHKARTGARWKDMPAEYGNPRSLQTQTDRWLASGTWEAAMELLKDEPGESVWSPEPTEFKVSLKPLAIESRIGDGTQDGSSTALRRRTPYARRSPAGRRRAELSGRAPRSP
ncbi:recombinase family protein [Streptomyces formicae]|uniref:recombinase family protein n=1 Tax=Streptomyces formicae TaxID=1616117 RepID=UPI0036138DFF